MPTATPASRHWRVQPEGGDLDAKLETLAKVIDLVSELNDEPT